MTQVLDDLLISLSLDPRKFMDGLRQTLEASKKAQQQVVKNANEIENQTNKSSDSINKLTREFQQFFSIIGGALGVNALKSLVEHMAMADAAVGRMAANLGTTPQALSAWGYAAQRLGGDANAAEASIAGLRSRVSGLTNFGEDPGKKFWMGLARGGVSSTDFLSTKDPYAQMMKVATAIQNIERRENRAQAYSFGKEAFGLDEGSVNVILQGGDKMKAMFASIAHIVPTDKDVLNAQKMQEAWAGLTQQMEALARLSYEPLTKFLKYLTETLKVFSGEKSASEANRDMSDNPDSYVGPYAFGRYYNRLARKRGSTSRAYTGDVDSGIFGGIRRYFYGNKGEEGASSSGAGSAGSSSAVNPESSTAGATSSTSLAQDRARFVTEMQNDPELRDKVLAISLNENGNSVANRAVIESMMNRASVQDTSLRTQARWYSDRDARGRPGYYDDRSDNHRRALADLQNPALRAMAERNLGLALGGSDTSHGATDNASQAWGANRIGNEPKSMFRRDFYAGGEYFGHANRPDAAGYRAYPGWRNRVSGASDPYSTPGIGLDWSQYGASFAQRTSESVPRGSISNNSSQMYLNGPISIETRATDADGFARDLRPAIEAQTNTFIANGGAH